MRLQASPLLKTWRFGNLDILGLFLATTYCVTLLRVGLWNLNSHSANLPTVQQFIYSHYVCNSGVFHIFQHLYLIFIIFIWPLSSSWPSISHTTLRLSIQPNPQCGELVVQDNFETIQTINYSPSNSQGDFQCNTDLPISMLPFLW